MKPIASVIALAALLSTVPAHAAQDMGLTLHNGPAGAAPRGGVGAQAGVTIRFGDRRTVRNSQKIILGVSAGPVVSVQDRQAASGYRRAVAGAVGFTLQPGYSTTFSLAGQAVVTDYTQLGAAEDQEDDKPKKKQDAGDKAAWVAAVAGGVMLLLAGSVAFICRSGGCSD